MERNNNGVAISAQQPAAEQLPRPPASEQPSSRFRRKKDRSRVRVTRACDRCKRRKVKCDGIQPCIQCSSPGIACTYNATYSRGRLGADPKPRAQSIVATAPPLAATPRSQDRQAVNPTERTIEVQQSPPRDMDHQVDNHEHSVSLDTASQLVAPSAKVSPEPSQTDLQGHYVGPASGVSFLLRVQKELHQTVSFAPTSSIFTFGDAPLPEHDPSFCLLLPRDEAEKLLAYYFDYAVPTHRFLHRPTVASWLEEFYQTRGYMKSSDDAPGRKAVLLMIFAQAQSHLPRDDSSADASLSARYFLAADQQLSKEIGQVRLTSVQARLAQCFWLLSQSRINHCWSLFGTTAHLAYAIGLNRNRKVDPANGMTYIEAECRRRTFWCAHSLDNYLSAALGRPRTFHAHDIDQELPQIHEDSEILAECIVPRSNKGQSLMLGPVAHVKLSQIVSTILWDLYSIHPVTKSRRAALTTKCSTALKAWRAEFAHFLNVEGVDTSLLIPIYQRQKNVLNLAYWHAMILTHRPVLLSNFSKLQQPNKLDIGITQRARGESSVRECLDAAMSIVDIVDALVQADQMLKAYWFTIYFAFSAVVVLYVYVIQQSSAPTHSYQSYLEAATRCQSHIAKLADNNSLTQRYSLVLEQLRIEAVSQTKSKASIAPASVFNQSPDSATAQVNSHSPTVSGSRGGVVVDAPMAVHRSSLADEIANLNMSPGSSLADIPDWNQFDSWVASGLSDLGRLFTDDLVGFHAA